jgi:hypothetical protein
MQGTRKAQGTLTPESGGKRSSPAEAEQGPRPRGNEPDGLGRWVMSPSALSSGVRRCITGPVKAVSV